MYVRAIMIAHSDRLFMSGYIIIDGIREENCITGPALEKAGSMI